MKKYRRGTEVARWIALLLTAGVGIGCVGGLSSVDDQDTHEPPSVSPADEQAAGETDDPRGVVGPRMHRFPPMGGPGLIFHAALHELELTDEQRADIESAMRQLHPPPPKGRAEMPKMVRALASAVRAGTIDPKQFEPEPAEAEAHMREGRHRMVAALQKLHQTLTPEQRAQLVTAIQARMAQAPKPPHPGEHPPFPPGRGPRGVDRHGPRAHGPLGFVLHGLTVSDAQREQLETALAKAGLGPPEPADMPSPEQLAALHDEIMAEHRAVLAAFATDGFDANAALPSGPPPGPKGHRPRFVEALAVIVPLLDETQRSELADRIEQGPPKGAPPPPPVGGMPPPPPPFGGMPPPPPQ